MRILCQGQVITSAVRCSRATENGHYFQDNHQISFADCRVHQPRRSAILTVSICKQLCQDIKDAGFKTAQEFLDLGYRDMWMCRTEIGSQRSSLKSTEKSNWTQAEMASVLKSSQSRGAKDDLISSISRSFSAHMLFSQFCSPDLNWRSFA